MRPSEYSVVDVAVPKKPMKGYCCVVTKLKFMIGSFEVDSKLPITPETPPFVI
jgi:hypothetical protein